jgi:ATP-dependent DNA helicase RecG
MIKDNGRGQFISELSIEQNLTFDYADRIFAEKEVLFGIPQKRTMGLIRPDGRYSNLALILSDQCPYTIKAAIFEGLGKAMFKDRKEFNGSIFKQLDDIYSYLHVFNRIRSTFEGFYRVDHPDYPETSIRESCLNAVIHRDYYINGSILISMFDDRLEFMSLGGVMPGVTQNLMRKGVSVSRNEKLAQIFYRLKIIDAFGTGIPRIYESYEDCAVQPEIPIIESGFLIQIPNKNYYHGKTGVKLAAREERIIYAFSGKSFSKSEAAETLELSESGAYKLLSRMNEKGLLKTKKEGKQIIYYVKKG